MSPDEAGFLKAIGDNPADETARLAYADWLADRDDPRAAFARLSADFLRSVRSLADLRRELPIEWLEVMDPLFNHCHAQALPWLGDDAPSTIAEVHVEPGTWVEPGQILFVVRTPAGASHRVPAEWTGVVLSVLVRRADRVAVGRPLLTYLRPQTSPHPAPVSVPFDPPRRAWTPREPLLTFIRELESRRESLRSAPRETIEAVLAHYTTPLVMVFGAEAVRSARNRAEAARNWNTSLHPLYTLMQPMGWSSERMALERIDIHIGTVRLLIEQYG